MRLVSGVVLAHPSRAAVVHGALSERGVSGGAAGMSGRRLLRITTHFACFGLDVVDGRVTMAPPIARWCQGKPADWCIAYWRQRGATVEWVVL